MCSVSFCVGYHLSNFLLSYLPRDFVIVNGRDFLCWCFIFQCSTFWYFYVYFLHFLNLQEHFLSKTAENKKHLARRLQLWKDRNIKDLLLESITINSRKASNAGTINEVDLSRRFSQLMMEGKINPALRLLEQGAFSKILPLTDETMQCLHQKHPIASPIYEEKLLQGPIKYISPVIYDNINAALIRKCAVRTNGASGPSGLDADCWKKMIGGGSFGAVSDDLCHAIALMARQLCIDELKDPGSISAISACRLIPLDKCPGLRPIGIGEVIRRIMGK